MPITTPKTSNADIIVDLADMKCTPHPAARLKTHGLGSCMAVVIYDPEAKVGGLLHFMLPNYAINPDRARQNPYLFADTGIPMLYRTAYKMGAVKERIICRLAGGANVFNGDSRQPFRLGQSNLNAAKEILARNNVHVHGQYVGGITGMTLTLQLESGRLLVELPSGREVEL